MAGLCTLLLLLGLQEVHAGLQEVPVKKLLSRIVGQAAAAKFELSVANATTTSTCASPVGECVTVSDGAAAGSIVIQGSSVSSLAFGVGMYLRERCNTTLTWVKTGGMGGAATRCGDPATLPRVGTVPLTFAREMKWTYYQNVVEASYSSVWWDWPRWQIEIDWMALSGINLGTHTYTHSLTHSESHTHTHTHTALMYTGQEQVLRTLYTEFNVNLSTATGNAAFFNGPAFLSWSRGQHQSNVGGLDAFDTSLTGSLPNWWIDSQAELGKQQATRMRELGITTILRGCVKD